jgi:hypothetical protein
MLRSARYSNTLIVHRGREAHVRKRRAFLAPLLVWLSRPLLGVLDAGVRVLPQRAWAERERLLHRALRDTSIRVDADGTLVLPLLAGRTLADLLEDAESADRKRGIELAVVALVELHARGFTHGDAMAENVMVDLGRGVAHWFDFENVHDANRPAAWRRADDVRALLTTCALRVDLGEAVGVILDAYADDSVAAILATTLSSVWRRSLAFHLGQAGLSLQSCREISRLSRRRSASRSATFAATGTRGAPRTSP